MSTECPVCLDYQECDCCMDCGECWDEDFGSFTCENCAAKHCITDLHFNHLDEMLKFCGECYHGLAGEE